MNNSKPTHLKLLSCAVMSIALGCGTVAVHAADTTGAASPTPAATGLEGQSDSTGTARGDGMSDSANTDSIDAADFVEEASAKGAAEIESAQKALEESQSADVRAFAEMMIKDHSAANEKLAKLAGEKDLEISDDATLMDKAKAMILQARDGESFDAAYANNQVMAHEQTIELFERAAKSDDADISAFAKETLPKLKDHLKQAQELVQSTPDE